MRGIVRAGIVVLLVAAVGAVLAAKHGTGPSSNAAGTAESAAPGANTPRLLDLGSTHCVPCKLMEPILDALRREYRGRLEVEFIDVLIDKDLGEKWDVWVLPTQVFLDANGTERFRHEGFYSKEEILAKWRELGVDLGPPAGGATTQAAGASGEESALGRLFASLAQAVGGAPVVALAAALIWGVLSVLLSPCHLSSIPLIVGFIGGQGRMSTGRACLTATLFSVGILLTIAVLGAVTAAAGRMMGSLGGWVNYVVAGLFFVVGLHLLGVVPMPWSGPGQVTTRRKGLAAAFVLGLVFGIALGPCTFAYMAPMLAVTFQVASAHAAYGALLLGVYGIGHCGVIVLAGTSTHWVQRFLNWNERSKGTAVAKAVCGVLVLLGGMYLVYIA